MKKRSNRNINKDQVANEPMKRHPTSLYRKLQVKSTINYYYICNKMAKMRD